MLGASAIFGPLAAAIGLLVWLSFVARVVLLAAEMNVVAAKRFWPRSFTRSNLTDAGGRSFAEAAIAQHPQAARSIHPTDLIVTA
jgi:uncharacterized BrkB/YihY/UPF0761 family membrane protein